MHGRSPGRTEGAMGPGSASPNLSPTSSRQVPGACKEDGPVRKRARWTVTPAEFLAEPVSPDGVVHPVWVRRAREAPRSIELTATGSCVPGDWNGALRDPRIRHLALRRPR
jgi:hypothetical protein